MGEKREKLIFILCEKVILTFILVQVSVTSSSGILFGTLVEFGWGGEGQDSGFPRGREGEEDLCLKLFLSTQTVENNKVTQIIEISLQFHIVYNGV